MHDFKYCYPNSNVLINKFNIEDSRRLYDAELKYTLLRIRELQDNPIKGYFDFDHLKAIHKYIFQDVYDWAGQVRTVEIGKGNLFCTTPYIESYASSVFDKYYSQCHDTKDNISDFIEAFASNYADVNALHPFREGNGRAQREFARQICLEFGYSFSLTHTTHKEMLEASIVSFNKGDNSKLIKIFNQGINKLVNKRLWQNITPNILTSDDLSIGKSDGYDYYEYNEHEQSKVYDMIYRAKIKKMDAEKELSNAKSMLNLKRNQSQQNKSQGFSL